MGSSTIEILLFIFTVPVMVVLAGLVISILITVLGSDE